MSYLWLDLTDVTLADEDTNSILINNANRAIQGNEAMQVTKFATNSMQVMQVMQVIQVIECIQRR